MNKKDNLTRAFEILPGTLTWATLLAAPIVSYFHPVWISIYIILFDLYWFLRGGNVAIHLINSYAKLKAHNQIDWLDWLKRLKQIGQFKIYLNQKIETETDPRLKRLYSSVLQRFSTILDHRSLDYNRIFHLIILPTVKEDQSILEQSIDSYSTSDYPKDKLILVLAIEKRAGDFARRAAVELKNKYQSKFFKFLVAIHPDGIDGEVKGKGANITYASKESQKLLDELNIPYEDVLVSAFDADTTVNKNYFSHLTFDFLTVEKPYQASYQPMPMYHNNIWDTPAIARVIATSSSFWQLVEASRPDRLITFSSHSMSFKTLVDVGFWRTDIIPEDSHIFWQCFFYFNGDYRTHPLFTTVSMDAVLGKNFWGTLLAQYKQKRRWAWGALEVSLVFPELIKNNNIPLWKKLLYAERLLESHYFWATASVMIVLLGWLPLILGGGHFGNTVLSANLPFLTRLIMSLATLFLIFSMYVNMVLLPKRPKQYSRFKTVSMILQWVFVPIVSSVFGSLPAIDAQTRLMLGKYMEFWVTPKIRKHIPSIPPRINTLQKQEIKP